MKRLMMVLLFVVLAGCAQTPAQEPTAASTPTDVPVTNTPAPTATPESTATVTSTPFPTVTPPAEVLDRFEQGARLGRGVNLGNALEAPNEGEWGMILEEGFFQLIAEAGFDTVRVPICWSAHAMDAPPYTIDETFFQRVDWVIENALANDLNVVINMHHYNLLFSDPDKHKDRFVALWRQIVLRYRDQPARLYFEPLNEPNDKLTPTRWNTLLAESVAAIRELDKFHTIVVTGAEWGGINGLMELAVPKGEENYVCSFHFYDPFPFTHQGAEWSSDTYSTGVQWPGPPETKLTPDPESLELSWLAKWYDDYNNQPVKYNPCGPKAITQQLDWAVKWGEKLDCHLWMGEFGAYSKADMQSRVNWTTFMREEAEKRGFSWSYWEFGAGFGVYDRTARKWNQGLLDALVPSE
ncbi:MAG: cellulase family glycosylhydrolase [Anaerolineae bacterium]|nr:cellulase family glycosylhydrolase [Anaerolineae bacterium]